MDRPCDVCGVTYVAKRATSKYCSPRCRMQASRSGGKVHELTPRAAETAAEPILGIVTAQVARELQEAGVLKSSLGAQCFSLAMRIDYPGADTGSAIAAVSRQLDALMEKATRAGKHGSSQQLRDELAERRRKHA